MIKKFFQFLKWFFVPTSGDRKLAGIALIFITLFFSQIIIYDWHRHHIRTITLYMLSLIFIVFLLTFTPLLDWVIKKIEDMPPT